MISDWADTDVVVSLFGVSRKGKRKGGFFFTAKDGRKEEAVQITMTRVIFNQRSV